MPRYRIDLDDGAYLDVSLTKEPDQATIDALSALGNVVAAELDDAPRASTGCPRCGRIGCLARVCQGGVMHD